MHTVAVAVVWACRGVAADTLASYVVERVPPSKQAPVVVAGVAVGVEDTGSSTAAEIVNAGVVAGAAAGAVGQDRPAVGAVVLVHLPGQRPAGHSTL